jgi:NRPS condensation-like uncharacterized protein
MVSEVDVKKEIHMKSEKAQDQFQEELVAKFLNEIDLTEEKPEEDM